MLTPTGAIAMEGGYGTTSTCGTCFAHHNLSSTDQHISATFHAPSSSIVGDFESLPALRAPGSWTGWRETNGFGWMQNHSGFMSSNTGPCYAADGYSYLFLETSPGSTGSAAYMVSPPFDATSTAVKFKYFMYGATMGTLAVETSPDGTTWTEQWSLTGQQHGRVGTNNRCSSGPWSDATVQFPTGTTQMRFKGVKGTSFTGDMAIDTVEIVGPPGTAASRIRITDCTGTQVYDEVDAFANGIPTTICLPDSANMIITTVSGSTDWVLDINNGSVVIPGAPTAINLCPDCAGQLWPDNTATDNQCGVCQATAAVRVGVNSSSGTALGDACANRFLGAYETPTSHCCPGASFDFRVMDSFNNGWGDARATFTTCNGTTIPVSAGGMEMTVSTYDPVLADTAGMGARSPWEGKVFKVCLQDDTSYKVKFESNTYWGTYYDNQMYWDHGSGTLLNQGVNIPRQTGPNWGGTTSTACIDSNVTTDCAGSYGLCDCTSTPARMLSPLQTFTVTQNATIDGQICQQAATRSCSVGDSGCAAVPGCMDSLASNYNSLANTDDASCVAHVSCFGNRTAPNVSAIFGAVPSTCTGVTVTNGGRCLQKTNYQNNERCTVDIIGSGTLVVSGSFATEANWDFVYIGYSGSNSFNTLRRSSDAYDGTKSDGTVLTGVHPNDQLKWMTDGSWCGGSPTCPGGGWTICEASVHSSFTEAPYESDLYIGQIADPNDNPNPATTSFIQLINPTLNAISLAPYTLGRYTNGNDYLTPTTRQTWTSGTAPSIPPGGRYTICASVSAFAAAYGADSPNITWSCDLHGATGGVADSNGDDNFQLLKNGALVDTFGRPGQDGSGTDHEFEDGQALRIVPGPSKLFQASDWQINCDSSQCTSVGRGPLNTVNAAPKTGTDMGYATFECSGVTTCSAVNTTTDPFSAFTRSDSGLHSARGWQRHNGAIGANGATGSPATGPNGAYRGSWFWYFEASGGGGMGTGAVSYLYSPTFTTGIYTSASFYYHMYGSNMGTLAAQTCTSNATCSTNTGCGSTCTTKWSATGAQHTGHADPWSNQWITIGTTDTRLQFKATYGNGFRGDMSIDEIRLFGDAITGRAGGPACP
jgi:hypothetical protein